MMHAKRYSPHIHQSTFSWGDSGDTGTAREHLAVSETPGLCGHCKSLGRGSPKNDATVAAGKACLPAAHEPRRRSARVMNLETGSRGSEFGMSAVSCGNGKLRQWLIDQIDSGKYPGLVWENEEKSVFRIPWKHAGKQDYNREEDAALFKVSSIRDPWAGMGVWGVF